MAEEIKQIKLAHGTIWEEQGEIKIKYLVKSKSFDKKAVLEIKIKSSIPYLASSERTLAFFGETSVLAELGIANDDELTLILNFLKRHFPKLSEKLLEKNSPNIEAKNNSLAYFSLLLGLIAMLTDYRVLGIVGAIVGFFALNQIAEKHEKGKGVAIAGIILGLIYGVAYGIIRGLVLAGY